MPSVKRLNSVLEDGLDIPRKLAKLDQRDTRIKELERDLEVMHEFVIEQDMLLKAPPTIRIQIESTQGAAKKIDTHLRKKIQKEHDRCSGRHGNGIWEKGAAMADFIPDAHLLPNMPEGLELAFQLVIFMGLNVYSRSEHPDNVSTYQAADLKIDEALFDIATRLKTQSPEWLPLSAVHKGSDLHQRLSKCGVKTCFTESFYLFLSWTRGPAYIQEYHDDLKGQISASYRKIVAAPGKAWRIGSDGSDMALLIPKIRRLGRMSSQGPRLAFELVMFFGRHTYTERPTPCQDRTIDPIVDELLSSLMKPVLGEAVELDVYEDALDTIRNEIKFLHQFGVDSYFKKSYQILAESLPDSAQKHAQKIHQSLQERIKTEYAVLERRLEIYRKDERHIATDWFSHQISSFIEDIAKLSQVPAGLSLAIQLMILVSEYSFPELEGLPLFKETNIKQEPGTKTAAIVRQGLLTDEYLLRFLQIATACEWKWLVLS